MRSRRLDGINGLALHVLEAGHGESERPVVLLLHGFPELAFSWRDLLRPLAAAGYHVIAPDRRGYGRTTGWDESYDTDLAPFGVLNQVADLLALLRALGLSSVHAVIGHDFGSPLAAWCALLHPDVFRSVVLMSSPFGGPPTASTAGALARLDDDLAALPRPRRYYMRYYTTRAANGDMQQAPQGLARFLRAYFHVKSADWPENRPVPLSSQSAAAIATLPTYYVMDLDRDMAATVAPHTPSASQIAACHWLRDEAIDTYAAEYARTSFQGGLNEYRCLYDAAQTTVLQAYVGRTIDVPVLFVGGRADWGVYQTPGALEAMATRVCTRFQGVQLIERAGHWVQQEQPASVRDVLLPFLRGERPTRQRS